MISSEVILKTRLFFVKRGAFATFMGGFLKKPPIFIWNPPAFFKSPLYLTMTRTFQKFASKWFRFSFQHGKIYMVLLNNETKSFVVQARSPKHERCKRFTGNFKIWKVFSTIPKHNDALKMPKRWSCHQENITERTWMMNWMCWDGLQERTNS